MKINTKWGCKTGINIPNAKFIPILLDNFANSTVLNFKIRSPLRMPQLPTWTGRHSFAYHASNRKKPAAHDQCLPVMHMIQWPMIRRCFQASQPIPGDCRGLPGENSWRSAVRRAVCGDGQWACPQDCPPHPAARSKAATGGGDPGGQHSGTGSRYVDTVVYLCTNSRDSTVGTDQRPKSHATVSSGTEVNMLREYM